MTSCFKKTLWKLCCCTRDKKDERKEKKETNKEREAAFWQSFYAAYSALSTPVIVGVIQAPSPDVVIVYVNEAAAKMLGYNNCTFHPRDRPSGLIGRDVCDLMTPGDKKFHRSRVARWLTTKGVSVPQGELEVSVVSDNKSVSSAYTGPAFMGAISVASMDTDSVEGRDREVSMVHYSGKSFKVTASLNFFASRGRRVHGIFSFTAQPPIPCMQFRGVTVEFKYKSVKRITDHSPSAKASLPGTIITPDEKENEKKQHHLLETGSSLSGISIFVTPPHLMSDFADAKKWTFRVIGGDVENSTLTKCKELVYKALATKLNQISIGSALNLTVVDTTEQPLSRETMRKIQTKIFEALNEEADERNMFMTFSLASRKEDERGIRFATTLDGACPLGFSSPSSLNTQMNPPRIVTSTTPDAPAMLWSL